MIVLLAGGVGGAKLAEGLAQILAPERLLIVVNIGDDSLHLGLHVAPDLDTVMYSLAGLSDTVQGWGRKDETWHFMEAIAAIGGEDWFRLGDRDLALHVERTRRLKHETLSAITADFAAKLGIAHRILPMSDDLVATLVETDEGPLEFHDYFVRRRCAPIVRGLTYRGIETARPQPQFLAALQDPALEALIVAPSNPFLSIEPILQLAGVEAALAKRRYPVVAVSPLIGGKAVKGPAAKIMEEFGLEVSSAAIARHYGARLDGIAIDHQDAAVAPEVPAGMEVLVTDTLMRDRADKARLAREVLDFALSLRPRKQA